MDFRIRNPQKSINRAIVCRLTQVKNMLFYQKIHYLCFVFYKTKHIRRKCFIESLLRNLVNSWKQGRNNLHQLYRYAVQNKLHTIQWCGVRTFICFQVDQTLSIDKRTAPHSFLSTTVHRSSTQMAFSIKNSLFQPFETHQRFPLTTTLWKSFTQSYSKPS